MAVLAVQDAAQAGIITHTFVLTSGLNTTPASPLLLTVVGLTDGTTTFDATLSISSAPAANLTRGPFGVGVDGGAPGGAIDGIESLTFALASITNQTGGTAVFNHFTAVSVSSLAGSATFSDDTSFATAGDNFASAAGNGSFNLVPFAKTIFSSVTGPIDSFFNDSVSLQFTATAAAAVPEPSTVFILAGVACIAGFRRLRKHPNAQFAD